MNGKREKPASSDLNWIFLEEQTSKSLLRNFGKFELEKFQVLAMEERLLMILEEMEVFRPFPLPLVEYLSRQLLIDLSLCKTSVKTPFPTQPFNLSADK